MLVLWLAAGVLAAQEQVLPGSNDALDPGAGGPVQRHKVSPFGDTYTDPRKTRAEETRLAEEIGEAIKGNKRKLKAVRKRLKRAVDDTRAEYTGGLLQTAIAIASVPDRPAARTVADIFAEYQRLRQEAEVLALKLRAIQAAAVEAEFARIAAADEEAAMVALLLF